MTFTIRIFLLLVLCKLLCIIRHSIKRYMILLCSYNLCVCLSKISCTVCIHYLKSKFLFKNNLSFIIKGSSIQVCLNTLRVVTHCPSNEEEYRKLSEKCSSDCLNNRFELHCVRNSSKKELIAVCAVPAPMFCKKFNILKYVLKSLIYNYFVCTIL